MNRVGLTGGIATGKSTVAAMWAKHDGVVVIEADHLVHEAYQPGTPTHAAVVQQFGPSILNPDQTINRQRLGDLVFANEQKRLALNQIVHPAVRVMWTTRIEQLCREGHTRIVVAVIPLLFEVGAENDFDYVVTVGCSEGVQRARLQARGLTPERADARILSQWPLRVKLDRADFVIWNDGALALTEKQAEMVWARMQES